MEPIKHRIDFVVVIVVNGANPNGDPNGNNEPRMKANDHGMMSCVCVKHKLRNQFAFMAKEGAGKGNDVLVIGAIPGVNRAACISDKLEAINELSSEEEKRKAICEQFRDVRTFGFLWASGSNKKKGKKKEEDDGTSEKGTSIGIRGPVTIQDVESVGRITPMITHITKCIPMDEKEGTGSDQMGTKYAVNEAAYVIHGSCNAYLAEDTGFSAEDANALKEALKNMFFCDESAARPAGTMEVKEMFWCESPSKTGSIPSASVFRAFQAEEKEEYPFYKMNVNNDMLKDADIKVEHWESK